MLESTSATFPGFRLISYWKRLVMSRALRLEYDNVPERVVEIAAPDDASEDAMRIFDE